MSSADKEKIETEIHQFLQLTIITEHEATRGWGRGGQKGKISALSLIIGKFYVLNDCIIVDF